MNKIRIAIFSFFILSMFFQGIVFAETDSWLYSEAVKEANQGNYEFAFLHLHSLARSYPESKYLEDALFTIGEHHFTGNNSSGAVEAFSQLLEKFPDSKSTLFSLAYLLKVAQARKSEKLAADLEKTILTFHKISLVFRDSKEFTYKSAFQNRYKAVYFIDKVEIYKNDELFTQVLY